MSCETVLLSLLVNLDILNLAKWFSHNRLNYQPIQAYNINSKKKSNTTRKTKGQHCCKNSCSTSLIYLQHIEQVQGLFEKKIRKGFHWTPQIFQRYAVLIGLVSHNLFQSSKNTVEPLLRAWVLTVKNQVWVLLLEKFYLFELYCQFFTASSPHK